MSARAEQLAAAFEQSARDLLAAVKASTPEQWAAPVSDGEWTQGFSAYHAAAGIGLIAQRVKEVAGGKPFEKMTWDEINAVNAAQAEEHSGRTAAETIELVNSSLPNAAGIIRSLSDEQLDRKVRLMDGMPEVSVEMMVQLALVGHMAAHLASITGAR